MITMPFQNDRQRRAAFANMNKGRYPEAPPQGMLLTESKQKTIGGEVIAKELPKHTARKIQPVYMSTEKYGNTQVMLRKDRIKPTHQVSSAESAVAYVKDMEGFDREFGVVLHLDTKNRVVGREVVGFEIAKSFHIQMISFDEFFGNFRIKVYIALFFCLF